MTTKILMKINKCEMGNLAVQQNLNMFHSLKLSELKLKYFSNGQAQNKT